MERESLVSILGREVSNNGLRETEGVVGLSLSLWAIKVGVGGSPIEVSREETDARETESPRAANVSILGRFGILIDRTIVAGLPLSFSSASSFIFLVGAGGFSSDSGSSLNSVTRWKTSLQRIK